MINDIVHSCCEKKLGVLRKKQEGVMKREWQEWRRPNLEEQEKEVRGSP